jgi:hypothetical protein
MFPFDKCGIEFDILYKHLSSIRSSILNLPMTLGLLFGEHVSKSVSLRAGVGRHMLVGLFLDIF